MQNVLNNLKIQAHVVEEENYGTSIKYFVRLFPGEKVNKIERCATEIALALQAYSVPIIRPITERGLVSIEVLTKPMDTIKFSDISTCLKNINTNVPIVLGKMYNGKELIIDLAKMPHILLSGTTGSGKSIMLHSFILSTLLSNRNIKLVLVDPKTVEFGNYSNIKQLLYPILYNSDDVQDVLYELIKEMENRFEQMGHHASNILDYNATMPLSKKMPFIIFIIDEFADLFMGTNKKDKYKNLCMLAQKSRACGIHIIIATQRPSVGIITGDIKTNFPTRISCRLSSKTDSRVILDYNGAEKLLGNGDAIINSEEFNMLRFKGAFVHNSEIINICENNKRSFLSNLRNFLGI